MLKQQTRQAEQFGDWQQLNASVAASSSELPHLEATRQIFAGALTKLEALFAEQAAMAARKQELSRQLQSLLPEVQRLSTVLRKAVAVHYGPRSEKLLEFRIRPFRRLTPKAKPEEPELPEAPNPPAPTVS